MKDYEVEVIAVAHLKIKNAISKEEAEDMARTAVTSDDFDIQTINAHEITNDTKTNESR